MAEEAKKLSADEERALRIAKRYLEDGDFKTLSEIDNKIKEGTLRVGLLEDEKIMVWTAIQELKQQRMGKVKQLELKYNIPEGCVWRIDASEKKIIFLDKEGNLSETPVVMKEETEEKK